MDIPCRSGFRVRSKSFFQLIDRFLFPGLVGLAAVLAAPLSAVAAPGIVRQASFDAANFATGSNGSNIEGISGLTSAGNGLFYGTTALGGVHGRGTIFEFDPFLGSITLKASFDGFKAQVPLSRPTLAANGRFYGTAYGGGSQNLGAIYQFDPLSGAITLEASFDGANGQNPVYPLSLAGNGRYYGTTNGGGSGSIFEFDPLSGLLTNKASFNGSNGSGPSSGLTPAAGGRFYGTTINGGANNAGTIYEFDPFSGSLSLKASFDPVNGGYPNAPLVAAGNGIYYGTTHGVGVNGYYGVIYEFDSSSASIATKASFNPSLGCNVYSGLTPAGNGGFYGVGGQCGSNDLGTLYEFNPALGTIALIDNFDGSNGSYPRGELTPAGQGRFFGTTFRGGAEGRGTVFGFDAGTASAPGPLPVIGAGAALGWSRSLRRRIRRSCSGLSAEA